ncbi:MAG: hypothetical protein H6601_03620 [Flavobacteriales bacterium]|nr:hypothetical protein [Flavobacteriales bacterium]
MNIPNLPTDSLYKFMALSGLVLLLFSNVYPRYLIDQIEEERNSIISEIGKHSIEINHLSEDRDQLEKEVHKLEIEVKKYVFNGDVDSIVDVEQLRERLWKSDYREYLEFIFAHKEKIIPTVEAQKQVEAKLTRIVELTRTQQLKNYDLERKHEILKQKTSKISQSIWLWAIGSGLGGGLMYWGFWLWYVRVQKPIDQQLRKETKQKAENLNQPT